MGADRIRLLHVDDNPHSVERRVADLNDRGFEVVTATDVAAGRQCLEEEPIDCVLSGFRFPDEDGLDFLEWVRREYPEMPFILLTSDTSEETVTRAVEAGVTDYIPKFILNISDQLLAHRIRQAVASDEAELGESDVLNGGATDRASASESSANELFGVVRAAVSRAGDASETHGVSMGDTSVSTSEYAATDVGPDSEPTHDSSTADLFDLVQAAIGSTRSNGEEQPARSVSDATDLVWVPIGLGNNGSENRGDSDGRLDGDTDREDGTVPPLRTEADAGGAGTQRGEEPSAAHDTDGGQLVADTEDTAEFGADSNAGVGDTPTDPVSEVSLFDDFTLFDETDSGEETSDTADSDRHSGPDDRRSYSSTDSTAGDETTGVDGTSLGRDDDLDRDPGRTDLDDHADLSDVDSGGRKDDADGLHDHPALQGISQDRLDDLSKHELRGLVETLLEEHVGEDRTRTDVVSDEGLRESTAELSDQDRFTEHRSDRGGVGGDATQTTESDENTGDRATTDEPVATRDIETDLDGITDDTTEEVPDVDTTEEVPDGIVEDTGADATQEVTERGRDENEDGVGSEQSGAPESETPDGTEELVSSDDYHTPERLDLDAGTSVLVQCGSQDERQQAACTDLLGTDRVTDRNVLLIRYKQMNDARLERIATNAERTKIVSIGYTQPVPQSVQDSVENVKINNPNDVTRLGIVVTGTIDDWKSHVGDIVVCYDPLDVLLRYKNVQSAFRFLHLFLSKLQAGGAISHFHVDPSAGDPQEINTLKPLFDAVLTIDSVGTHLETQ